jgi:hypothetical protein|tara:strand:+ start:585 stop:1601 length:1017 start_codon:yes stop_codon:yes gene_type:complete
MGFKRLDAEDFVVSSDAVQSTAWSTNSPTLTSFFTSSAQKGGSSGNYYLAIYQTASTAGGAAIQFDVAYGNVKASGSTAFNATYPNLSPSSTIYGQFRTMILEDENSSFIYGSDSNTFTPDDFYVLSVDRARYKESIFPGTLNIAISGSGGLVQLTDNSNDTNLQTFLGSSKVFQIVSGSNGSAVSDAANGLVAGTGSYGLFFPELGTILLNPKALEKTTGIHANTGSAVTNGANNLLLFNGLNLGGAFTVNSQETISSDFVFVRARNSEFNYSTNPSFISGSTGAVVYDAFVNNPQVYMTTVGMYNDANECVAVAKLSRPLVKDFTKEALIRVKLDF